MHGVERKVSGIYQNTLQSFQQPYYTPCIFVVSNYSIRFAMLDFISSLLDRANPHPSGLPAAEVDGKGKRFSSSPPRPRWCSTNAFHEGRDADHCGDDDLSPG